MIQGLGPNMYLGKTPENTIEGNKQGNMVVGHLNGDLNQELNRELLAKYQEVTGLKNTNSNVPLVCFAYNFLKERGINVHTPAELIRDWDALPQGSSHYFDSCGVALYPNDGVNEDHRQRVLGILGKISTEIPLIVTGLNVSRNGDIFQFEDSEYVQATEATFLQKNGKVEYDETSGSLVSTKKGVKLWTPNGQDGLRRVYRNGNGGLNAGSDYLSIAGSNGRVPIWQDTKCLDAKILEELPVDSELAGLSTEYLTRINELTGSDEGVKYLRKITEVKGE